MNKFLLASSTAILMSVPAHGQVQKCVMSKELIRVDYVSCYVIVKKAESSKIISEQPCTSLQVSNTIRTKDIHFTSADGTTIFVIDNSAGPRADGNYDITCTVFVPRGKSSYLRLPAGQGGYCSMSQSHMLCSNKIEGRILLGHAKHE